MSSEQLSNITFSGDNIIESLFAKNGIDNIETSYFNDYTENSYKFNVNEDIVFLKIYQNDTIYGLFNFTDFNFSCTQDQDNVEFKNIKTVVKIKKIIETLSDNLSISIIIIRNNYAKPKIPNLFDFTSLSSFTDNYSFYKKTICLL